MRNSFDCVAPCSARSDRWVRDLHHVGSSHRTIRHHERRYFHRPRRGRLSLPSVTGPPPPPPFNIQQLPSARRLALLPWSCRKIAVGGCPTSEKRSSGYAP